MSNSPRSVPAPGRHWSWKSMRSDGCLSCGCGLGTSWRGSKKLLAVDQKSRPFGDLVVQHHRARVGLLGHPIDARDTGLSRLFVDGLDQLAADALPPATLVGKE